MSSIVYPDMFWSMEEGLGAFIKERRRQLGISQTELASRIGVSQGYMSQLEGDKVGLPGADLRRRIARALSVSHLDVLVATGELMASETGPSTDTRSDAVRRLQGRIDDVRWTPTKYRTIELLLDTFAGRDNGDTSE